jgi:hypothetical protein
MNEFEKLEAELKELRPLGTKQAIYRPFGRSLGRCRQCGHALPAR